MNDIKIYQNVLFNDFFKILSRKAKEKKWILEKVKNKKHTVKIKVKNEANLSAHEKLYNLKNIECLGIHINDMFDSSLRGGLIVEEEPFCAFLVWFGEYENTSDYHSIEIILGNFK